MLFALKFLDEMLGDVVRFRAENPDLVVVFAASMGQDTVHRDFEGVELAVGEVQTLMKACGLSESEFKPLLAMVPQVAVEIENPTTRLAVKKSLEKARTATGRALFRVEEANASLSITIINPPKADVEAGRFSLNGHDVSWHEGGVRVIQTEPGTAYHIPEGVMAVWGSGIRPDSSRRKMSARDCKRFLLELGGVAARGRVKSA
jgi:hypothetical protein